ncbi:hypothetical protein ACO0OL_004039 [Hanseniaspora opuntiae]
MSDSDSDFEIIAISNADGVIIDDKEALNAEFKKVQTPEETSSVSITLPDTQPNLISETVNTPNDEHFMDVEEENNANKNVQHTILLDSQDNNTASQNVVTSVNNSIDPEMDKIMDQLKIEVEKGKSDIALSQSIQDAKSNYEQTAMSIRNLISLYRELETKRNNLLIVLRNKLTKKQKANDTHAVNQLFERQQHIVKLLEASQEIFEPKIKEVLKDLITTHDETIKNLGNFFNKETESSPSIKHKTRDQEVNLMKIKINKMKRLISRLYDGTEQVDADDNFFGTAETHVFKTVKDFPKFRVANTPTQKQILDRFLSIKSCGYNVDIFLKKQEQWMKIQEEDKLRRLEKNVGSNANDIEREYMLAIQEYESNDDTLGIARIQKRESPFLPDDVLKNMEQASFNKLGMRYGIDDLKYRYSGWLDENLDITIKISDAVNVPRSLVIDDDEKYPIHLLEINYFLSTLIENFNKIEIANIKALYKGYKVIAALLMRCTYATHVLATNLQERKKYYDGELLNMQKSNSFNLASNSFASPQLQGRYNKIVTLISQFEAGIMETTKVLAKSNTVNHILALFNLIRIPNLSQLSKTLHTHRVNIIKRTLLETGNKEFQEETARRFNIRDIHGQALNDGMTQGQIISATDIDDFHSLIRNMAKRNETSEVDTPSEMNCQLMKHQKIGLHRLLELERSNSRGGLLSDEMGLGKTIQMIALMVANKQRLTGDGDVYSQEKFPVLIIAPVSLLHNWKFEIQSKVKADYQFTITTFHENNKPQTFAELKKFDVVLTSYSTLGNEYKKHLPANYDKDSNSFLDSTGEKRKFPSLPTINFIKSLKRPNEYESPFYQENSMFYRIILDESHEIKNLDTGKFKSCSLLRAKYRWCLSGTPIQNNVYDIFAVIKFLRIKPFMKDVIFKEKIGKHLDLKKNKKQSDTSSKREAERLLQGLISTISIRRTKDTKIDGQALLTLPELNDHKVISVMDEDERLIYDQLESNLAAEAQFLIRHPSSPEAKQRPIFTLLLRLRQACIHFILVKIGELKSEMRKLTDSKYSDAWKGFVDDVNNQHNFVTVQVNKFIEMGGSCAMCNEVPEVGSTHAMQSKYVPKCGHCICGRCIETIDEEYRLVDPTVADFMFKCPKCSSEVLENDLIPTSLFYAMKTQGLKNHRELAHAYDEFVNHIVKLKTQEANIDYATLPTTAKIRQTIELIKEIKAEDPEAKILIFCSFTTFFSLLSYFIDKELQMPFVNFDGTMNVHKKSEAIETFRNDPDCSLMLISLKAGNVGLTLTMANHVILVDPYWNPSVEDQAIGRAHRISQNKPVRVHRLLVENTVEDRILTIQQRKKELAGAIIDAQTMKEASALDSRELGYLFGLNALNDNSIGNNTRHVATDEAEFYE